MVPNVRYLRFEAAEKADDERIVDEREDVALGEHLLHLIAQHERRLPHPLHRETAARVAVPHQIYRSAQMHMHFIRAHVYDRCVVLKSLEKYALELQDPMNMCIYSLHIATGFHFVANDVFN